MTAGEIQAALFAKVRAKQDVNIPLADEIARLLGISTDSAYRRIRGEKTVSLEELHTICMHYKLSVDQLMGLSQGGVMFEGQYIDHESFSFEEYITSVMRNLAYMNSFSSRYFYYHCKDLPIFHHYHFKEIAAFKWFFWMKTYLQSPGFDRRLFRFTDHPDSLYEIGKQTLDYYNNIPSAEIWNLESMNIIIRQIDFYRDSHVFSSEEDVLLLYEAIDRMWDHLEKQAALGYKFDYGDPAQTRRGDYKMYFNEVLLGDNTMLVELDGKLISYMSHTTINFMLTKDPVFTSNMYNHVQNQMKRSTLISEVSEKERSRFFRIIRDRIAAKKQLLRV